MVKGFVGFKTAQSLANTIASNLFSRHHATRSIIVKEGALTLTKGLKEQQVETNEDRAARDFVSSKMFANIFAIGMELVEETATYLDGQGREAAKSLSRAGALSYAGCSMRLTTRLMQIASWLLVLRAVREGEMSYAEAASDKYRLTNDGEEKSDREQTRVRGEGKLNQADAELPERLIELVEETDNLHQRIARIDQNLFPAQPMAERKFGAASQLEALRAAFSKS